jgi:hypothetical protein
VDLGLAVKSEKQERKRESERRGELAKDLPDGLTNSLNSLVPANRVSSSASSPNLLAESPRRISATNPSCRGRVQRHFARPM